MNATEKQAYPSSGMLEPLKHVFLVASGDLRLAANQACWAAQEAMEEQLSAAFAKEGLKIKRAHAYNEQEKHGFISSQRMGMDVFKNIPADAALIVAEAVWQYSHHLLAGLRGHRGPILTVANWSGQWPGLVGLLNLNGSLTKAAIPYSTIWSQDFRDEYFLTAIRQWIRERKITHDTSHVRDLDPTALPAKEADLGRRLAQRLLQDKAIIGVFDEGCMGMYNAIIDDELLNPSGIYKERLSQSALLAEMQLVTDKEAKAVWLWLKQRGMTFLTGEDEASELTEGQLLEQCKMYIAALRLAQEFDCDAIGIQYQQGLKDMAPASDLAEGLLNNVERPPVYHLKTGAELYPGQALPHFNEVDEGAAVDALVTNRAWTALGFDPATTLHDLRWGEWFSGPGIDDFVWVFLISGAAPASHFIDGYAGAKSERQPPMYFPKGGGTMKGISKPGDIVWSRVFIMGGTLQADLGLATVVELPAEETERRWQATTAQWPIMHAVLRGVSRDQMMARHKANHIQVAYAPTRQDAARALAVKAAMFAAMGISVHLCGDVTADALGGAMSELLLGIDIGTYSSKGVLVEPDGSVLKSHVVQHGLDIPKPGWAEQDADAIWWHDLVAICHALLDGSPHSGADVAAVAISAIGPCLVPLDKQGKPLRKAILYGVDTRAAQEIKLLNERLGEEAVFEHSGMTFTSQAIGPKILWLKRHEPELWRQTDHLTTASSYLLYRLSGEKVIDRHTASHFMPLMDIKTLEWSDKFAEDIAPLDMLPRLGWSDEIAGYIQGSAAAETGLKPGTPVAVGAVDALSEAISVGAVQAGDLMIMYGSTTFFILVLDEPVPDKQSWTVAGAFKKQYNLAAGMATTGSLTRWFKDELARELPAADAYEILFERASAIAPGAAGLLVLPYFSGERTPINDPKARGVIAGLTLSHSRDHLYRAVLEGVAYGIRHNIEAFRKMGVPIRRILAVGGGAQSNTWLQIVSDVTGESQILPQVTVGASYGDAFLAGRAAGLLSRESLDTWVKERAVIRPFAAHRDLYEQYYRNYLALYKNTRSIVHSLG